MSVSIFINGVQAVFDCGEKRAHLWTLKSYRKSFLDDFLSGDCKTWTGDWPFVADEVV